MRRLLFVAVIVLVIVGAAVAAVPFIERHAAERLKQAIERDGSATVAAVEIGLLDRSMTLRDLRVRGVTEVGIGQGTVSGLSWPWSELLEGRTPLSGFRFGDPLQASHVELRDLSIADPAAGRTWTIDWLMIDGFDLARFEPADMGPHALQISIARALSVLEMARVEERNVTVGLAAPGGGTMGMASVLLERYRRGHIDSLKIAGLGEGAAANAETVLRIADVNAAGVDLRRVLASMSSDDWAPGDPTGRLHVDRFSASGFSGEGLKRYGISLGELSYVTTREGDRVLRSRLKLDGFVLAPPLLSRDGVQLRLALTSMGLKELRAQLDCAATEDREKGELTLDRCAVASPGLADIDLTARFVHLDDAFWQSMDEGDPGALSASGAALASARLVLADKTLLERSMRGVATVLRQQPAQVRADLARDIRRYQPPGVLISQSMTRLLDTVALFVERGGTLTVDARPDPPLGFDRLQALDRPGADLVTILGLTATLSK
ncbi:MAG: hypothetical protein ACOY4R_15085 [Pseudomonadota bacterium]